MAKKLISLVLAAVMILAVSAAAAKTVEPDDTEIERLAGATVHATVGEWNEDAKVFQLTLYDDDRYDIEDIEELEAGDVLLAGGGVYRVKEKQETEDGGFMVVTEDGYEIVFVKVGDDDFIAQSTDDDRRYMHAFAVLYLPAAEGITYEDYSDPDQEEATVTTGLEEILKIKAEKERNSIGFDFYATMITLNESLEIELIHQAFDVAQ
jgi:hypothetical protein